jgi:hypothetical protein
MPQTVFFKLNSFSVTLPSAALFSETRLQEYGLQEKWFVETSIVIPSEKTYNKSILTDILGCEGKRIKGYKCTFHKIFYTVICVLVTIDRVLGLDDWIY